MSGPGTVWCGFPRAFAALAAAALFLIAPALRGYVKHLSDDDVREAYLFGQRHDATVGHFFDQYEKTLVQTGSGPQVRAIGVRTPYSAAVLRSYEGANTYTARKAQTDFAAQPNVFEVVVWIDVPLAYPVRSKDVSLAGLARSFRVEASQEQPVVPLNPAIPPAFQVNAVSDSITGIVLRVDYDVHNVASASLRVQVTGPDDKVVSANFDLNSLR